MTISNHFETSDGEQGRLTSVISIGYVSPSLNNYGWFRNFNGSSLLIRCLEGLKRDSQWPVVAILEAPCSEALSSELVRLRVTCFNASAGHWLRSIGLTCLQNGITRALLVHGLLGLGLFPKALSQVLLQSHSDSDASVTFCNDLPSPLYIAVCERSALEFFANLPEGIAASADPNSCFRSLESISATLESANGPKVCSIPLCDSLGLEKSSIPGRIPLDSLADVRRIEAAIGSSRRGQSEEALRTLRELLIRDWDAEHHEVAWCRSESQSRGASVLFASVPSAFSGAEQALISTVEALRGSELDLHCLISQAGLFSERMEMSGASLHCPHRDFGHPSVPNFLLCGAVLDAIRPSLLHCNAYVGVPLLAHARAKKIPILQWARLAHFEGILDHLIAADMITAVSSFVRDRLIREMIDVTKIRVLYDGINTDYFGPPDLGYRLRMREHLSLAADEFAILCAARFVRYKRHDVLLRGFAIARNRYPKLRLLLAGDSGSEDTIFELRALISRLGIEDAVEFTGFVTDTRALIAAADAIALCSDDEPLGCSVLESMSMAKPTILSSSGGFPEMITDGHDGLLFKPGDPEALAQQITTLVSSPELCITLAACARRTIQHRFSLEAHASAVRDIYEEILERKNAR